MRAIMVVQDARRPSYRGCMTAMRDRSFPFGRREWTIRGVTSAALLLTQHADLRLRGSVPARVLWPPTTPAELPALLVVESDSDEWCAEQSVRGPAVVLAVRPGADHRRAAYEWALDHAAELGADPDRVILAGQHQPGEDGYAQPA
jgi:hypothetical protein